MVNLKLNFKLCFFIFTFLLIIGLYFGTSSSLEAYTPAKVVEGIDAFPTDYQVKLKELAKKHSNWKFVAVYTYLDWNSVVSNEMVDGRSLVSTTFPSSWKKDGREIEPGWVNASKVAVEYSIDPRNFLSEEKIFQFELSEFNSSAHTKDVVEEVLKGTDMYKNNEYLSSSKVKDMGTTYSSIIYNAAKKSNVSASHVASRIIQENGGKVYTNLSINGSVKNYEGYYNFMNIGAYCTDSCGKPYIHGLQYAKDNGWTTPQLAIQAASDRIRKIWVNYGQNTIYFEKWDVNYVSGAIGLYSSQYMTNITAPSTESTMMYNAYKNAGKLNSDFVFYIPVYLNMPNSSNEAKEDDTLVYLDDPSDTGVEDTFTLRSEATDSSSIVKTFTFTDDNKVSQDTPYIVVRKKNYTNSLYDYVEIFDRKNYKTYYGYIAKDYIFEYPKNEIKDTTSPKITLSYTYNKEDNTVKVTATSDEIIKNNKSSWTFSSDGKSAYKIYSDNTSYSTNFYDEFNNATSVNVQVTQVDKKGPQITVKYISNDDGTVTVNLISNEMLKGDKSSSWILSDDKKTYSRTFDENTAYTTTVRDIYGNSTSVSIKIDKVVASASISYSYNEKDNTVTASMYCKNGFKETKPTWTLSEDKKTYTKVYNVNGTYTTDVVDLLGNRNSVKIEITGIKENIVSQAYNAQNNTVTVSVTSLAGFKQTKPTWTLSKDKKTYTKVYSKNSTYTTPFTYMNGEVKSISFTIDQIDDKAPNITITKVYNVQENTVTIKAVSDEELNDTKSTWTLSEDKKTYTKVYKKAQNYITPFEDKYSNVVKVNIKIDNIKPNCKIETVYNQEDNTVTVIAKSNTEFKDTKETWTLSEDKKTYTKVYNQNGTYTTSFVDKNSNEEMISFKIDKIYDKKPNMTVTKVYNVQENTVTIKVVSDQEFKDTKSTWTLSEDKKTYTKVYTKVQNYTTPFEDKYSNVVNVNIQIDSIEPNCKIETLYNKDNNTVTVNATSNTEFKNTKVTWTLSKNKKIYTKVYNKNGTYTTLFIDKNSNEEMILFTIDQIDDKAPNITITKVYNAQENTVTIKAVSDEELKDTKPTWTLSEDKKTYTKEFTNIQNYTTPFEDKYSNVVNVNIKIDTVESSCKIETVYNQEDNTVTVIAKSNTEFKDTKVTWTLSEDKKTYTKVYNKNGIYETPFVDKNLNEEMISFKISEIK